MNKPNARQCQPCTACCDGWVQMNIRGADVYPGCACPHSTGKGCNDYANRPIDPCDNFNCGWVIPSSPLPEWMKPRDAKVVVLFNKFQWQGLPVDLATPVGKRIPPRALNWLKQFAEQQGRPLVYLEQDGDGKLRREQQAIAYGPPAFQQEVAAKMAQGQRLWV
ncbi:hypothetical protein [Thiothrix unzii]|uniref:Uncharacterized protein n=1 Tax=Thiothrix unzii TaxID=111769 RepID=A0A975IGC6_9GAMM|nr:hypothetical protein [Thiothrix unzii]QTR52642.1 hypothetical protein J9260_13125 [Thiothrix unzii]